MAHAEGRPSFQAIEVLAIEFCQWRKTEVRQRILARGNNIGFEINQVHDAQMDPADWIGIVIEQADDPLALTTGKFELFLKLACHRDRKSVV